jgi:hypothetical protein
MGGNLAWTLRLSDGTEYRMDRWTNAMADLIINPLFFQEDKAHINECVDSWLAMKEDWEKNKDTGNYKLPQTGVYAPYPYGMKPSEYGIVVSDFHKGVFLTNQGYTGFDRIDLHWVMMGDRDTYARMRPERYENIMRFAESGRVKAYSLLAKNEETAQHLLTLPGAYLVEGQTHKLIEVRLPGDTGLDNLEKINAALPTHIKDKIFHGWMILDTGPFTVEEFEPTSEGWTKMLARVLDLNFFLSHDELAAWEERIQYELENEAEDA